MKKNLYSGLIGIFLKKGLRLKSQRVVDEVLSILARSHKTSKHVILLKLFRKLNLFVEVKRVRSFRGKNLVPFLLNYNRRVYLICKWINLSAAEDTSNIRLQNKLVFELSNLLSNSGSKIIDKKNLVVSESISNRSNAHYRW